MCRYYRNRVTCWCVRHNDGWCACKEDKEPDEGATNVETKCDMFIVIPLETAERIPTCPECLAVRHQDIGGPIDASNCIP
jgi:hypothetical protein